MRRFEKPLLGEESLVVVAGSEFSGSELDALVKWGLGRAGVRFAYLGDHANSRGAADMGLLPDLLPGYAAICVERRFRGRICGDARDTGKDASPRCSRAGLRRSSWLVRIRRLRGPASIRALKNTFVVVQDLFLTETAALADVVFPAASLYEKTGTVTNTFGDLQMAKKAADHAGVKPDFEILVRLADSMGVDVKKLVPFGKAAE